MKPKVLLIIPAYNEEATILKVSHEICAYRMSERSFQLDYIIINDGSTDRTKEICEEEGLPYLDLPFNLGIGGAVQTGYLFAETCGYDIAVQFDGDGQHDIAYLEPLIQPLLQKKSHFSVGSRFIGERGAFQSTFSRRIGIRMLSGILNIFSSVKMTDPTSGFRAADREAIHFLAAHYPVDYPEPESLADLSKKGFSISEVPVVMRARAGGVSSISTVKSIYYMVKVSLAIVCRSLQKKQGGR